MKKGGGGEKQNSPSAVTEICRLSHVRKREKEKTRGEKKKGKKSAP